MSFGVDQAIEIGKVFAGLAGYVFRAVAEGKPERVEKIIPATLRSELTKAKHDAELEEQLAKRREYARAGMTGAESP